MNEADPPTRFLPRWLIYVMVPGFLGPLLILAFIFVSELAFDVSRCPYATVETRRLSDAIAVREDRRVCLWDVEERRFSVVRGERVRALGRRRFRASAFAPGHYRWTAQRSAQDEVSVHVYNEGHDDAAFREGTPKDERR
jgi:hypothetical protein